MYIPWCKFCFRLASTIFGGGHSTRAIVSMCKVISYSMWSFWNTIFSEISASLTPMCNIAPAGELGEDQGVQSTAVSRLKCCGGPLYPSYSVFVVHTYVHTVLQCSFP